MSRDEGWHEQALAQAVKAAPFMAPSISIGAVSPSSRSPATRVVVFQWPCGPPPGSAAAWAAAAQARHLA